MADIPVFTSPRAKAGLSPSGMGSAAAVMEGQAWEGGFHKVGGAAKSIGDTVEKYYAQSDASKLGKDSTEMVSDLTKSLNEHMANSDPNDRDAAEKWKAETLEPALIKLGMDAASKTGDDLAEKARQAIRSHFTQKADADTVVRSGIAVQNNMQAAANAVSNTAYNDPSSLEFGLDLFHAFTKEQLKTHDIDAVTAARLQGEFTTSVSKDAAQAAVRGLAERNPAAAIKALEEGRFNKYLSGEETSQLKAYATSQNKIETTAQMQKNQEAAGADMAKIMSSVITTDGKLTLPLNFLGNVADWSRKYSAAPGVAESAPEKVRAAINFANTVANDLENNISTVTDPHTYDDFMKRAFLPPGDPRKLTSQEVMQARGAHLLSDKDFSFWNQAVNELSKDENQSFEHRDFIKFIDGYKGYITKSSFLNVDAQGNQKFYEFQSWATSTRLQMKAQKASEKDIRAVIVNAIPQFQVPKEAALKGMTDKAGIGLKPLPLTAPPTTGFRKINPGESWEAYKKARGH